MFCGKTLPGNCNTMFVTNSSMAFPVFYSVIVAGGSARNHYGPELMFPLYCCE